MDHTGYGPGNFAGGGDMNERGRGGFDALKDGFRDFGWWQRTF